MKNNQQTEELQSRREFFKVSTKKVLPILGAITLINLPIVAKAAQKEPMGCKTSYYDVGDCSHCSACYCTCEGSCSGKCTSCSGNCYGDCEGNCKGDCQQTCQKTCQGSCITTCAGSCKGDCSGSARI